MTRMYFDVQQVREFLLRNGHVATLRDPRITKEKDRHESLDLWVHDGSSRWGKPLGLKANRVLLSSVGTSEECGSFADIPSFASADEWWAKATGFYKPSRMVEINGKDEPVWSLDMYYVHLLAVNVRDEVYSKLEKKAKAEGRNVTNMAERIILEATGK